MKSFKTFVIENLVSVGLMKQQFGVAGFCKRYFPCGVRGYETSGLCVWHKVSTNFTGSKVHDPKSSRRRKQTQETGRETQR